MTEVSGSRGRTTFVTCDLHTYTLWGVCMCVITSGRTWGSAAEEDAVGEQQLKRTQLGSSKLKGTRSGNSSGNKCSWGAARLSETNARQRHYCTRLLVRQSVAVPDSCRRDEKGETSEAYLQQREKCCVPRYANTNGSSSSNLCTMKSCRCWTAHAGKRRADWSLLNMQVTFDPKISRQDALTIDNREYIHVRLLPMPKHGVS